MYLAQQVDPPFPIPARCVYILSDNKRRCAIAAAHLIVSRVCPSSHNHDSRFPLANDEWLT